MPTNQTNASHDRTDDTTLTDSRCRLAGLLLVFAIVIVLLESGGLLTWAQNLPIGPWRNIALPVVTTLHNELQPLGIEPLRIRTLAALDRLNTPEATDTTMATMPPPPALSAATPVVVDTIASLSHVVLPMSTTLPPLPPMVPGQPRVVALVGDSMMAVGLSDNLLRGMAAHTALAPVRAFRSGTGLSRPEVFNWMRQYPSMLNNQRPNVIIVAIGANDAQGFVENGKVMAFGTDDWVRVYETRLRHFLDLLTQHGAQVVWIGLPPMRSAQFNTHIDLINRIAYRTVSQNPRACWWNSAAYLGDAVGHFREYAKSDSGNGVIRLRGPDGIHMFGDGGALLAAPLLAWLDPVPAVAGASSTAATSHPTLQKAVSPGSGTMHITAKPK